MNWFIFTIKANYYYYYLLPSLPSVVRNSDLFINFRVIRLRDQLQLTHQESLDYGNDRR